MSDKSPFLPENMRKRFHELGRMRQAILAKTMPLRAQHDKIVQEAEAKSKALSKQFRSIEAEGKLFDIDMERATLARALGGKTGKPE